MARRAIQRYKSGRHLLKKLTDNPALPTFVKRLEPATLKKLIDEIGVEDSAALIELSSTPQMVAVLDDSIWGNELPGAPETFQRDEFLRWLQAMLEVGEEFCADRLSALSEDVLVTALSHFLDIEDLDKHIVDEDEVIAAPSTVEAAELYGPFAVSPKVEDHWDILNAMLHTLDEREPDLLQALLYRCQMALGRGAELDAAYEHEMGREKRGFVTPESARTFLRAACAASLDELAAEVEYDLDTARSFRLVDRARAEDAQDRDGDAADSDEDSDEGSLGSSSDAVSQAQARSATGEPVATDQDFADLQATVNDVEFMHSNAGPALMLEGPATPEGASALHNELAAISTRMPDAFAQRLAELAYLSNVVISGSTLDGDRFSQTQAAEAVSATCSLGLDYLGSADLALEPGLIRLFRIGWNLVQGLPLDIARRAIAHIQSVDSTASMRGWMLDEISRAVSQDEFLGQVAAGQFEDVHETLDMLSLVISQERASELVVLVSDMPRLFVGPTGPSALEEIAQTKRFVASLDDLDRIDSLLDGLLQELQAL